MSDSERVALVTGGAKRVGHAIVEGLAGAGFHVAFTYLHSEEAAHDLERQVVHQGRRALRIRADLTQLPQAVEQIDREFGANFGRLDVLVNNASIYEEASLDSTDLSLARRMMSMHFEAPLLLCQRFAPQLRAARGHVVNMCDLLAERPWPKYLAYCASKAALLNLTLGLARELAPEVTVNALAPGVVEWPPDYPAQEREKYLRRVPLQRAGTPDDVAQAVLFLCEGGKYITGQVLRLDGGRSIT